MRVWRGRVHGQERHRLVGVGPVGGGVEGHAEAVRELGRVAEGGEDIGVARQRPEVELVVAVERRLVAQPGVGRVGVLVDLRSRTGCSGPGCRSGPVPVRSSVTPPSEDESGHVGQGVGHVLEARCGPCPPTTWPRCRRGRGCAARAGSASAPEGVGDPGVERGAEAHAQGAHLGPACPSSAVVHAAARVGSSAMNRPSARSSAVTRSAVRRSPRRRAAFGHLGRACRRRHRTSASRWSLEAK